ncbi:MAG: 3-oxoacyl-ACP reductase FabG [Firmicutes bacterium]|nr:3-oxoacyl-ACP reductase FabG [Bacillota bacterium]
MDNSNLVAIITGGSRGIGKAISKKLAQEGYTVIINYVTNQAAAEETVAEITEQNGKAQAIQGSVSSAIDVQFIVDSVLKQYGRIDVLINNAGIKRDRMLFMMKVDEWNEVIATNLIGPLLFTRAVLKPMIKQKFGKIINISSISGLIGTSGQTNYATTKAALIGFTRSLAKEVAQYNITVNAIAAGYVSTDMLNSINQTKVQQFIDSVPLKRFARADEISGAVLYLLSESASYITGQTINIDGGITVT